MSASKIIVKTNFEVVTITSQLLEAISHCNISTSAKDLVTTEYNVSASKNYFLTSNSNLLTSEKDFQTTENDLSTCDNELTVG